MALTTISCMSRMVTNCIRVAMLVLSQPRKVSAHTPASGNTPIRKNLAIWLVIPIIPDYDYFRGCVTPSDEDDIIAALKHPDRACHGGVWLDSGVMDSQLGKIAMIEAMVMQEPFLPQKNGLKRLEIRSVLVVVVNSLVIQY